VLKTDGKGGGGHRQDGKFCTAGCITRASPRGALLTVLRMLLYFLNYYYNYNYNYYYYISRIKKPCKSHFLLVSMKHAIFPLSVKSVNSRAR
jgi:hypothetical protein